MPPPEPTIFQALVVNKEPELMLKGAAFKEGYNTLLQCSTILSHGEWLQCAVLELLDRLLDAFKGKMEDSAVTQETLMEWGKMATDAKDIVLEGAKDVNDAGRLSLQTSGLMQLVTRDAYLVKVPYACPLTVKDTLRQAPLGGPNLFSDESVTSAIEAKTKADSEEFQKRILSDKKPSGSRYPDKAAKSDRADVYRSQERSSGNSNFRGGGNRQDDGSQDRKPRKEYNNNKGQNRNQNQNSKSQRGGWKDKGGGRGRGRRDQQDYYRN
jgi:hypothetical protein